MTQERYNELMAKTTSELLAMAQEYATRYGVKGVIGKPSKWEIISFLNMCEARAAKYGDQGVVC
jgi:hypothetical protein